MRPGAKRGEYNAKIAEHNELVGRYNALVEITRNLISTFNKEVDDFNACLRGWQNSKKAQNIKTSLGIEKRWVLGLTRHLLSSRTVSKAGNGKFGGFQLCWTHTFITEGYQYSGWCRPPVKQDELVFNAWKPAASPNPYSLFSMKRLFVCPIAFSSFTVLCYNLL